MGIATAQPGEMVIQHERVTRSVKKTVCWENSENTNEPCHEEDNTNPPCHDDHPARNEANADSDSDDYPDGG